MRKLLLLFAITFISVTSVAQTNYVAHRYEMKTDNDVYEFENKNASELYQLSKVWISEMYKNPDRVIVADIENKLLKVNGFGEVPSKGVLGNTSLNIKYSIQIDFKDNRIRVNITSIEGVGKTNYSMFFKRDESRRNTKESERYLTDIESYFNTLVYTLLKRIDDSDEDW